MPGARWHVPCTCGPSSSPACPPRRGASLGTWTMALLPFGDTPGAREPRTIAILAKTIYRELRSSGFQTRDVIALAGELLAQVTTEVRAGAAAKPASQNGSSQSRNLAK